jgi:alpha-glucosidase
MSRIAILLFFFSLSFPLATDAQKTISLASPDGNIVYTFGLNAQTPFYSIAAKKQVLIDKSPISLRFDNGNFQQNLRVLKSERRDTTETYELVVGKTSKVTTRYKELCLSLQETDSLRRRVNLRIRLFNEGVAFRYEFPEQKNWPAITLLEENTSFKLKGNPALNTLFLPSFTTSHEGLYTRLLLSEVKEDVLMDMPTLFEFPGNTFMAITEAALSDYAGMYLIKHNDILSGTLSPLPGQAAIKVKAKLPHRSPWRVMMISDKIGTLFESNILTTLNEPNKIGDVSWLTPGKTTFPWWNGNIVPDTINAPGNNFVTNKYYIDFCARNKIEYHSVVEYGLHEWYTNDGVNFQPGPHADVTKPVPGLDMKEICDYGKSVGVKIRVWVHWAALYPKLDSAFAIFEKWGLSGMMIDFMDRDDQEMVNIQEEMLQKAARHHLHVQFHGAYKPTGMHRSYPNEFTREGTLNYETNKWGEPLSPDHDIRLAYTRLLAGATDYHLGGFRAVPLSKYRTQYTRPLMAGTRCHMLAMYVVLESYVGMLCDYPDAYEGQPGFEFLKIVPTTWDETVVVNGEINKFITIARRKGNDWFVGTINDNTARDIEISLNFLGGGEYTADRYTDSQKNNEDPNLLEKKTEAVKRTDIIHLKTMAGGGEVMHIRKK